LQRTLARRGVVLVLCGLHEQPLGLMRRSGRDVDTFGEANLVPDGAAARLRVAELLRGAAPPAA